MTIRSLLLLLACFALPAGALETPLRISVSNYPLAYFAGRIGGEAVQVLFNVPENSDPAFFKPDAKAVVAMQKADLIVINGADYEEWRSRVSLPENRMVDTSESFKARLIRIEHAVTHNHGPQGQHSHAGIAFTTWLDFDQAARQAETLAEAMKKKRPGLRDDFSKNLAALLSDLAALDQEMKALGEQHRGQALLGSHPVYQYLARRYGLFLESVHWEPDSMPSESEWQAFGQMRAHHPASLMIWEGAPSTETRKRLGDLGVESVIFDPCANRPPQGDFLTVMRANIENLKTAWR